MGSVPSRTWLLVLSLVSRLCALDLVCDVQRWAGDTWGGRVWGLAGSGSVPSLTRALSWQVNGMPFRNLTREEAVQFLLGLPPGEDIELITQSKQDSECLSLWASLAEC